MFSARNSTAGLSLIQMANSEGSNENKGGQEGATVETPKLGGANAKSMILPSSGGDNHID